MSELARRPSAISDSTGWPNATRRGHWPERKQLLIMVVDETRNDALCWSEKTVCSSSFLRNRSLDLQWIRATRRACTMGWAPVDCNARAYALAVQRVKQRLGQSRRTRSVTTKYCGGTGRDDMLVWSRAPCYSTRASVWDNNDYGNGDGNTTTYSYA